MHKIDKSVAILGSFSEDGLAMLLPQEMHMIAFGLAFSFPQLLQNLVVLAASLPHFGHAFESARFNFVPHSPQNNMSTIGLHPIYPK
jgi:hypothetical protein